MSSIPYETPDIYIASFLLSQGAKFISVTRVGKRRNIFRFESSEKLHELLRLYWRQVPYELPPAQLFAALRRLRSASRLRSGSFHIGAAHLDHAEGGEIGQADNQVTVMTRVPGSPAQSAVQIPFNGDADSSTLRL